MHTHHLGNIGNKYCAAIRLAQNLFCLLQWPYFDNTMRDSARSSGNQFYRLVNVHGFDYAKAGQRQR